MHAWFCFAEGNKTYTNHNIAQVSHYKHKKVFYHIILDFFSAFSYFLWLKHHRMSINENTLNKIRFQFWSLMHIKARNLILDSYIKEII